MGFRPAAAVTCLLFAAATLACSEPSPVQGRFYKGLGWIEFAADGRVKHGEFGDIGRYRIEGQSRQRVVVYTRAGESVGRIVNPTTVEFPEDEGPLASAFGGRWVARTNEPALEGEAAREASAVLLGAWRIPHETYVLEFRQDGSYQWGPSIAGRFNMLGTRRVRMTVVENGKQVGLLDQTFVLEGAELRLTTPDGAVTKFERVN